jgi:hypothetical protein
LVNLVSILDFEFANRAFKAVRFKIGNIAGLLAQVLNSSGRDTQVLFY